MTRHAAAAFEIQGWVEKPYAEFEGGRKLTRASVRKAFHGVLEGERTLKYLLAYPGDGTASYVGLEHVVGRLGGRAGSFVIQHSGADDGHAASGTWFVVPGSGTGELRGLKGQGGFSATRDEQQYRFGLDYDFELYSALHGRRHASHAGGTGRYSERMGGLVWPVGRGHR